MSNQNIQLNIGDEIGFVIIKRDIDSVDETVYFPVVEITTRDNERAYRYMYPDGNISASAIRQSELKYHSLRINSQVQGKAEMLCLSNRKTEFLEAVSRGENSRLEVFNAWERDSFHVKNHDNGKEYRVNLKSNDGKVFADCECADYIYRNRVCKHIGAVLTDSIFGVLAKN